MNARGLVVVKRIIDAVLVEPGARLVHGLAVLDAVDGDGHLLLQSNKPYLRERPFSCNWIGRFSRRSFDVRDVIVPCRVSLIRPWPSCAGAKSRVRLRPTREKNMIIKSSDQVSRFTWLKRFPIPRNFKVTAESADRKGAHMASPRRGDANKGIRHLSLQSRFRRQSSPRQVSRRPRRLRADGSRCANLDQEQGGFPPSRFAARAAKACAAPAP